MTKVKDEEAIESIKRLVELFLASFVGAIASNLLEPCWSIPFPSNLIAGFLVAIVILLYCLIGYLVLEVMARQMKRRIRKSKEKL